ncbi:hypothetical protein [Brevundimonas sp.]|uniref:hypothetical protein n=1 Tax=Brevundimonas sp. TaxID=1871086 RepID=UPI003BABE0D9
MTYRKTHLWISLVVGLCVWGAYFTHVVRALGAGDVGGLVWWFVGALVVMVIVETAATGLIAWLFRWRTRQLDDGPTLQAALKASHVALMILVALVLISAAGLSIAGLFGWSPSLTSPNLPVIAANALLAMVVVAELARAAFTLALIPRR